MAGMRWCVPVLAGRNERHMARKGRLCNAQVLSTDRGPGPRHRRVDALLLRLRVCSLATVRGRVLVGCAHLGVFAALCLATNGVGEAVCGGWRRDVAAIFRRSRG